mmetsp:Transcript_19439/g.38649  ORF Transcript_19439/g.38649 Transcript_19439/m.38649 type:complete len:233 (-) Transcript_19439:751-1449(-)
MGIVTGSPCSSRAATVPTYPMIGSSSFPIPSWATGGMQTFSISSLPAGPVSLQYRRSTTAVSSTCAIPRNRRADAEPARPTRPCHRYHARSRSHSGLRPAQTNVLRGAMMCRSTATAGQEPASVNRDFTARPAKTTSARRRAAESTATARVASWAGPCRSTSQPVSVKTGGRARCAINTPANPRIADRTAPARQWAIRTPCACAKTVTAEKCAGTRARVSALAPILSVVMRI